MCFSLVEAQYKWKCSQPEFEEDEEVIRYLPSDVPSRVNKLKPPPHNTATELQAMEPGLLFIYQIRIPRNVPRLTKCSGTVTAMEYCFNAVQPLDNRTVFTFYIMTNNLKRKKIQIEDRFDVWSNPSLNQCHMYNTSLRCCDKFNFLEMIRFQVCTPHSFTFGVSSKGMHYSLLGFSDNNTSHRVKGFQQNISVEESEPMETDLPLRLVRLVISSTGM